MTYCFETGNIHTLQHTQGGRDHMIVGLITTYAISAYHP